MYLQAFPISYLTYLWSVARLKLGGSSLPLLNLRLNRVETFTRTACKKIAPLYSARGSTCTAAFKTLHRGAVDSYCSYVYNTSH